MLNSDFDMDTDGFDVGELDEEEREKGFTESDKTNSQGPGLDSIDS